MVLLLKFSLDVNVIIPGEYPGESVPPEFVKILAAMLPEPFKIPVVLLTNVPVGPDMSLGKGPRLLIVIEELLINVPLALKIPETLHLSILIIAPALLSKEAIALIP